VAWVVGRAARALIAVVALAPALAAQVDEREAATERLMEVLDLLHGMRFVEELANAVLYERNLNDVHLFAYKIAEDLSQLNRVREALEVLDATLARFPGPTPNLAWLYRTRGSINVSVNSYEEAMLDLDAATAALPFARDPMVAGYVEGLRAKIYLDLGLYEPALRSCSAARAASDDLLAAKLSPSQSQWLEGNRRFLQATPELLRSAVQCGMSDYEGAVQTLEAMLSDRFLFPPEPERSRLKEESNVDIALHEFDLHVRRGNAGVMLVAKEQALGRFERAAAAASKARADLEPLLELDESVAFQVGAAHYNSGLLNLAFLEFLERRSVAAERALAQLAMKVGRIEDHTDRTSVRRHAIAAKIHLLQLEEQRAAQSLKTTGDPVAAPAGWRETLQGDATRLATAMQLEEDQWLRVLRPREGLGFLGDPNHRTAIETRIELALALDPAAAALCAFDLAVHSMSLGTLTQRIGGPSIVEESYDHARDYLAALPPGSGALILLPLTTQSYVLAADAEGVVASRIAGRFALEHLAEALIRDTSVPPASKADTPNGRSSRLAATCADLSSALFPPEIAERLSSWKRIVFVGTELLGQVPMESLPLSGKSIGETHFTSYAPGLALSGILTLRWPLPAQELAIRLLAGPRRDDALGLDLAPAVVRSLQALRGDVELRLGPDARIDEAGLGDLGQVQVLAFLAHGHQVLNSIRPAVVALASSDARPDGLLTCVDVEALAPRAPPLVLFLTCQSATGPRVSGDAGVSDLGGAALLGGAGCALVATSDIALTAATALLEVFLEELESGRAPDEALAAAKRALAQKSGFDDPFYLHSVRLFGVAHLPLVSPSSESVPARSR
jgi:tetratricopeptide (TPR) repeat protein